MSESRTRARVEVSVWTDRAHGDLALSVLELMGSAIEPMASGGPSPGDDDAVAGLCAGEGAGGVGGGVGGHDDFRKMLVDHPAAYVLVLTRRGVRARELALAGEQGSVVLTLEPIFDDFQTLRELESAGVAERVVQVPGFVASAGYVGSAEPMEAVGGNRLMRYSSMGRAGEGSVYARLLDGWRVLLGLAAIPRTVDASLVDAGGQWPEELARMHGGLACHARGEDGEAMLLEVSDRAARVGRSLHVVGDAGQWEVCDGGYELYGADGHRLDGSFEHKRVGGVGLADLIAQQWRRLIDRGEAARVYGHADREAQALACCLASLLSVRTEQPEEPAKLLGLADA